MSQPQSTEGMSAREAMRWLLDQPEGTEFEARPGWREHWIPQQSLSLKGALLLAEDDWALRIAPPKPAAPERVAVNIDGNGDPCGAGPPGAEFVETDACREYIRKDIAEAMVPRGREVVMVQVRSHGALTLWMECQPADSSNARRALILDGYDHEL